MIQQFTSSLRARRVRNALLASVFTVGIAGAAGTGALLGNSPVAVAQPVEAPAVAPSDFTAVVETVKPAVVSVQVKSAETVANRSGAPGAEVPGLENMPPEMREFFRRFGGPRGFGDEEGGQNPFGQSPFGQGPGGPEGGQSQGSGFFISADGYLVTNAHVVEGGREITVAMDDGRELEAKLIGSDERTDLALLKVEGNSFAYVNFAKEQPKIGQWVIAVGNPFGLGGTVTAGIISAEGRDIGAGPYDNFLQIDAPVNRGNSGGPTFNTKGEVIGVNTAIFSPSGGNVGIAFAIPANTVQEIIGDLREDGVVTRGWLGVRIQPVTEEIAQSLGIQGTEGAIVADAQADGPAAESGVLAGDVITKVNGEVVADPKALSEKISRFEPEQKVTVTVLREGKEQQIDVTLGDLRQVDETQEAKASPEAPKPEIQPGSLDGLGLTIEKNPNGEGVVVTGVADDSPAAGKGLTSGDVIVAIGGQAVNSVADVEAGVTSAQERDRSAVLFKVQGEEGVRFVGVPFEKG
jgi:serine protease Do